MGELSSGRDNGMRIEDMIMRRDATK